MKGEALHKEKWPAVSGAAASALTRGESRKKASDKIEIMPNLPYKSKNHPFGWFFDYNYLYFLLRAASDFFLRLTLGFS